MSPTTLASYLDHMDVTTTARTAPPQTPLAQESVTSWVRLGTVALAAPQLIIGVWAVLWPHSWFDSFPGLDPRLIAAEPPFNHHLAVDVGAAFLATGLALLAAAVWARRSGISVALLTYLAFTTPHVLYHATNPAPALSGSEQALNVMLLSSGALLAIVLAWGAHRPTEDRA